MIYMFQVTLILADVFEKYLRCILEISGLKYYPAHFLSTPGLAWPACLKKTGIILELLTDVNILLMVKKGIRG